MKIEALTVYDHSFLAGGARTSRQDLHPHMAQLNNTLLTVGALTLLLQGAFFGALDHSVQAGVSDTNTSP